MGQVLVVTRPSDVFVKGPDEIRDIPVDWSDALPDGVTITGSVFTADAGLSVVPSTFTDTATAVRVSGGTGGRRYQALNTVALSDGQVYEFPFTVKVRL